MSDINDVRKRIQKRRNEGKEEKQISSFSFTHVLYRMVMLSMCICLIVLAILLNQKLSWVKLPAVLQEMKIDQIAEWIPFENWFSLKEETVSAMPQYTLSSENLYSNGTNIVYNAFDGIVLHVQKTNTIYSVTLQQDNGVMVTYGSLLQVDVKQDERILKGNKLGTYQTSVAIDFVKNQNVLTFEQAMQSSEN